MTEVMQGTGTVISDGVPIFYRRFGMAGKVPVFILHGANYFDSADWAGVAARIATDREVVAIDQRGFGQSGWSRDKNYSDDAHVKDMIAVLDDMGWRRAVILGHSRGGLHAMLFASRLPHRTAGLVLADSLPGGAPPSAAGQRVNKSAPVFPTLEALQMAMSRDRHTPPGSDAHRRLLEIVEECEGGFVLGKRDPDFANDTPVGQPDWQPDYRTADMWAELARATAPVLLLRSTLSNRINKSELEQLRRTCPRAEVAAIDGGHDLAATAPQPVIKAVQRFLAVHANA